MKITYFFVLKSLDGQIDTVDCYTILVFRIKQCREYPISSLLFILSTEKPKSQNFLDPGLAKPQSQLILGLKIQTWAKYDRTYINNSIPSFDFGNRPKTWVLY